MSYQTIRRIKGKPQYKINMLSEGNRTFTAVPEILEKLAQSFSEMSSNENYSHEFQQYETTVEQTTIEFASDNTETYNRAFTCQEMQRSLSRTRNTAPGEDGVYYQILKNMSQQANVYLCKVFNHLWQHSHFFYSVEFCNNHSNPQTWQEPQ